jgi:choline transporter-like protein 2/4/5
VHLPRSFFATIMSGYESLDVAQRKHRKLAASEVGYNAPRTCTDTPMVFVFLVIWILMIVVASVAVHSGNLSRLTTGVDYLGNICGQGTPQHVTSQVASTWKERKALFFPLSFTVGSGFNLVSARSFPICVFACPERGKTFGNELSSYAADPSDNPLASSLFTVNFDSSLTFGRCLPNFLTFNCSTVTDPQCKSELGGAANSFEKALGLQSTALRSFAEVKSHWWVVLVCALIAVVVSFAWMFILRRLVKPVVCITLFLVFVLLVLLGGLFMKKHMDAQKQAPNGSSADWYLAFSIITWIGAFLYVCVGVYLWKDVMIACDIIEEASKIPVRMPTMVLVPPVVVCYIIPLALFALFIAAEIQSAASLETNEVQKVQNTNSTGASTGNTTTASHFQGENWRVYAHIFNVFVFLWSVGFIHAIGYMVIALCAVFWYWSTPGDEKDPENGVMDALRLTCRYHLGSLALGSLIVAIIQTIRIVLAALEKHLHKYAERSDTLKFILCCANCCLAYFERVVKFINKNAYIIQSLTGESFLPAARHALQLLVRNALSVGAVNIVGEYVMLIGKLLITCLTLAIAYGIMEGVVNKDGAGSAPGLLVILICVGFVAYFIAASFTNVFGVCIDTVLLSYCYDLEQNNGADRPYYCPDDLRKHVGRAEMRVKDREIAGAVQGHSMESRRPLTK